MGHFTTITLIICCACIHVTLSQTASSIAFAMQNKGAESAETEEFDCSKYDCKRMGIKQLCVATSFDYDETRCPFAKYCCNHDDDDGEYANDFMKKLVNHIDVDDERFVFNFEFTTIELKKLWTVLGA